MSDMLCIDLCSGLGGFSKAFVDAGWEVVTVDVEPKFKPTFVADVCELIERPDFFGAYRYPDVLLASPPCNKFSVANTHGWPQWGIKKAMEVAGACFEAVARLEPKWWLIENPRGKLRKLAPFPPAMTIRYSDWSQSQPSQKPTDLWGNISLPIAPTHRRPASGSNQTALWHARYTNDAAETAKVPIEVSQAVLEAVSQPQEEPRR